MTYNIIPFNIYLVENDYGAEVKGTYKKEKIQLSQ